VRRGTSIAADMSARELMVGQMCLRVWAIMFRKRHVDQTAARTSRLAERAVQARLTAMGASDPGEAARGERRARALLALELGSRRMNDLERLAAAGA